MGRNGAKARKEDAASVQVNARLPPDLVALVDAFAERLRTERPGLTITRSDAFRVLVTRGLSAAETDRLAE